MRVVDRVNRAIKREKEAGIGGSFMIMKSILRAFLIAGAVLSVVSSCATVPMKPLASGEVRLLNVGVPGAGIEEYTSFAVNIFFEAVGNPYIKRICFFESRGEPYCFDVSDVPYFSLGRKTAFQVYLPGFRIGSHKVECYGEYIRDGETRKTNVIFTQISVGYSS